MVLFISALRGASDVRPFGTTEGESQRGVAERHALPLCPLSGCLTTASPLRHRLPFRKTHLKRATAPVRGQPRASGAGEGPGVDGSKEPPGLQRGAGAQLSDTRMYSGPLASTPLG